MPSPFPGMDPFLELQEWEDFHTRLNTVLSEYLTQQLRPSYAVRVERRIYVERGIEEPALRRADVAVLVDPLSDGVRPATQGSTTMILEPVECIVPMAEEHRESRLIIRERDTMEVVTVIETLSPANKRPGSQGRREYLEKREAILDTRASLVELDLLLGGQRMPVGGLPDGDYFALVRRGWRRARADVYAWRLAHRMPVIPIPLKQGDREASIDLQVVVNDVYERAGYDMTLNYDAELTAPLNDTSKRWLRETINHGRSPQPGP